MIRFLEKGLLFYIATSMTLSFIGLGHYINNSGALQFFGIIFFVYSGLELSMKSIMNYEKDRDNKGKE